MEVESADIIIEQEQVGPPQLRITKLQSGRGAVVKFGPQFELKQKTFTDGKTIITIELLSE